jgi:hypothetical protein
MLFLLLHYVARNAHYFMRYHALDPLIIGSSPVLYF